MSAAIIITAAERDQLLARLRRLEQLAAPDPNPPSNGTTLRADLPSPSAQSSPS